MAYTQLAFDPSNKNLGVAVGVVDELTGKVEIKFATTYYIEKLLKCKDDEHDKLSIRSKQVKLVKSLAENLILMFGVNLVVTEKPVLGFGSRANPDSHANQWESISALRQATITMLSNLESNLSADLEILAASNIKAQLGVPGNNGDKELITKALEREIKEGILTYSSDKYLPKELDEHANDAVAILLAKVKQLP